MITEPRPRTMTTATTAAKEKERETLLEVGAELIAAKGVTQTTLEEIAKQSRLDIKKAKVHFADSDAVLDELLRRELDDTSELFTKVVNDRGKADIKLTRLVRELMTRYQSGYHLYHVVTHGMEHAPQDDPILKTDVSQEHVDKYRQNTAILGRLIAQGQSDNLFTDIDPLEAAYMLRGMIRSALMYRRVAQREGDMRDTADAVMRVFLKGLLR